MNFVMRAAQGGQRLVVAMISRIGLPFVTPGMQSDGRICEFARDGRLDNAEPNLRLGHPFLA